MHALHRPNQLGCIFKNKTKNKFPPFISKSQSMLPLKRYNLTVDIQQKVQIKFISPAEDQTFVLIMLFQEDKSYRLTCINSEGYYINEFFHLKNYFPKIGMLNESQVLLQDIQGFWVHVLSLDNYFIRPVFEHSQHFSVTTHSIGFQTFHQSKMFCVYSWEKITKKFRVSYFNNNQRALLLTPPIWHWQSPEHTYNPWKHTTKKINNHSKIGWIAAQQNSQQQFFFTTIEISNYPQGRVNTIRLSTSLGVAIGIQQTIIPIISIQELKKNVYLFHTNIKCNYKPKGSYLLQCFSVDISVDSNQAILKQQKYIDKYKHGLKLQKIKQFQLRDQKGWSIVNFTFVNDQFWQKIVPFSKEDYKIVEYFFGWDEVNVIRLEIPKIITDKQLIRRKSNRVTLTRQQYFPQKDAYLHLLLHLNEDFDDDLLQDAVELLDNN